MSDAYVTGKVREALKATNGDRKDAVKLLITWAVRDQALLLGLAKPDLKGLVMARIEEIARSSKKTSDSKSASEAIVFPNAKGEKRHPTKVPPPKSSERQASVMHQIAAAFRKKG